MLWHAARSVIRVRINSSNYADSGPRQGIAADRASENRDQERSLERSARDRDIRELDRRDRISFGEFLKRENLETPILKPAVQGPETPGREDAASAQLDSPKIGDVFSSDAADDSSSAKTIGYGDQGQPVQREPMSGFTARLIDVIA